MFYHEKIIYFSFFFLIYVSFFRNIVEFSEENVNIFETTSTENVTNTTDSVIGKSRIYENGEMGSVYITYTSQPVYILVYDNNLLYQKNTENSSPPLAIRTNTELQLEKINSLENLNIYQNREWQIPKNSSFLITQYSTTEEGLPDFDNPTYYSLSATSDTILTARWIRSGFTPRKVPIYYTKIRIYWDPNGESDLSHYNIYRSKDSENFVKINSEPLLKNEYIDSEIIPNNRYWYKATAVDTSGNESKFSNMIYYP
ncbi:MAG: hypothetical protein ACOC3V_03135 [bacterium]